MSIASGIASGENSHQHTYSYPAYGFGARSGSQPQQISYSESASVFHHVSPEISEASTSNPTSPVSNPGAGEKRCSVRRCPRLVSADAKTKMCERCRGKHRVYAVTKRAKRKMEKAAILEEATGIPAEPLPTQNKAKPVAESQSLRETQPSQLNYWDSAMLDPQPLPAQSSFSSSSALAGALGPMHFGPAGNSPSPVNDADPATRRCCSVKGCKTLISRRFIYLFLYFTSNNYSQPNICTRCVSRAEIGIAAMVLQNARNGKQRDWHLTRSSRRSGYTKTREEGRRE